MNRSETLKQQNRVRQKADAAQWIRRILILLLIAWMTLVVLLPVGQVIGRAVTADIPIAIFGENDIRIGGRQFQVKEGTCLIDGEPQEATGQTVRAKGCTILLSENGFSQVSCREVLVGIETTSVKPVVVQVQGDRWRIDGADLDGESYQRQVSRYIGLGNFSAYFTNRALYSSLLNSLVISTLVTFLSVLSAFLYAFGVTRTRMAGKFFFRVVAMLPLFAPTMLFGLSLVYLFGNKGLITTGFFGALPWLATDIGLYGPVGIVIAETVFAFPAAYLILMVSFSGADARLYEAADSLGAGRLRTFMTVTLPGVKFGLVSALFVCFTLSFTDFGAPKIVGRDFPVLAVEIYKNVVGQQNFGMGATISILLLIPALISFVADRIVQRRKTATIASGGKPFTPKRNRLMDWSFFSLSSIIALFILSMLFAAGYASLVEMWPYRFALTLRHYTFADTGGGGYGAFANSLRVSAYTALFGTIITFVSAYLIEKTRRMRVQRQLAYFLSLLPLAIPGLVIGISYIFFFNKPAFRVPLTGIEISNPFHFLYQTVAVLVIANIVHFFTVSFLTATTALSQMDKEYETVSESMNVPFYRSFFRVTVPVSLPAILEIAMYYFVSSMATVSAVIFLYSADTKVASVAVVNMNDAGDIAPASAMCMLIVLTNVAVRILFELIIRTVKSKTRAWRST